MADTLGVQTMLYNDPERPIDIPSSDGFLIITSKNNQIKIATWASSAASNKTKGLWIKGKWGVYASQWNQLVAP